MAREQQKNAFEELCESLAAKVTSSTVHDDDPEVHRLMNAYESKESEWEKYAIFDPRKYTRNLVDEGNGTYNLIVLCWSKGQGRCVELNKSEVFVFL